MAPVERQQFMREYVRALREGSAALFVGAGISRAAGYVDWKQLLREVTDELGLDIDREADLVAVAQYHVNNRQSRDRLNQLLIDEFLDQTQLTESHRLIATLPAESVWTTNYDDLLEQAYAAVEKRADVKRRNEDFAVTRRGADVTVYKMHGDKTAPAEAVLTKDDYETYNATRELFTIALKADLAQKTFLFLGVSFTDPNLLYLLGRVRQLLQKNGRTHFCLLRDVRPDGTDCGDYDARRFRHWLTDLSRYNIRPVLIDHYGEVPKILRSLARGSLLRSVFISGSAADFMPMGEAKFKELCRELGSVLIERGYNVVSGYGLGVGDSVVLGAMQRLRRNDDQRLRLWPFPQEVPQGTDRPRLWREYRERMLASAGVCVVLAGNKLEGGAVVPAGGVRQEAEIAKVGGKVLIPVGATGHVARELWAAARRNPEAHFGRDVSAQLDVLGDEGADARALAGAVVEILKALER